MTTIIYRYELDGVTQYIGSSFAARYSRRQGEHLRKLRGHGIESNRVAFFVLEECNDDQRFEREGHYIDIYKAFGYELRNVTDPRLVHPKNFLPGVRRSEEHKRKISEAMKGRLSPMKGRKRPDVSARKGAHNPKISEALRGRKRPDVSGKLRGRIVSEETRSRISASNKGRIVSEDTKKKISQTLTGKPGAAKGKPSPTKGIKRPKTSATMKGRPAHNKGKPSPNKGKKMPAISAAKMGHSVSEDARRKMSIAKTGRANPKLVETVALISAIQQEFREQGKECSRKQAGQILKQRREGK